MKKLKAHPYADLFPMMTSAELEALAADIADNGLRQPVVRYQGMTLDGRNRLVACEKVGVEPTFTDFDGDDAGALALVISLNVQRRDLTAAQRAVVAAKAWGLNGYSKGGRPRKEN
jgi:ParB-like chromosome segregation protein Spo0J